MDKMDINKLEFNNNTYKIIKSKGLGYYKEAFLAINCNTQQHIILFLPAITNKYNNIEKNKKKFIQDINELESMYKLYKEKCLIRPIYTSKENYVILTEYIDGRTLYRYLSKY